MYNYIIATGLGYFYAFDIKLVCMRILTSFVISMLMYMPMSLITLRNISTLDQSADIRQSWLQCLDILCGLQANLNILRTISQTR